MTDNNQVILTAEQVREWKAERAELQRTIADAQEKLSFINRRLEAVAILTGTPAEQQNEEAGEQGQSEEEGKPMIDAAFEIIAQSEKPLTKGQLKGQLRAAGYAESRLGNYFYTVIARLKKRNKITVMRDGRMTRSAPLFFQEKETSGADL